MCEASPSFLELEAYHNSYETADMTREFAISAGEAVRAGWYYDEDTFNCSGTLISRSYFLTAGHCNLEEGDEVRFNYQADFGDDIEDPPIALRLIRVCARRRGSLDLI